MATTGAVIHSTAGMVKIGTGIRSLDYVLDGGVHVYEGRYPAVIITGLPGTGKSILSATIACQTFRSGRSVAYFTLEQKADDVQTMITQFDWKPEKPDADFYLDRNYEDPVDCSSDEPRFLIGQFPMNLLRAAAGFEKEDSEEDAFDRPPVLGETLSEWDVALQEHIVNRIDKLYDCGVIVLDSLSDAFADERLDPRGESYALRRSLFQRICDLGRKKHALVVVILERRADAEWRHYLPDVVIELGWQPSGPEGNLRRYVQVKKARFQEIVDGRHEMRILPETGIVVYPIQAEVLRRARATQKARPPAPREVLFCVDLGFNEMLEYKIVQGSATLLYGQDATRKNVIVSRFLQQGLQEDDGCVLFLAAGTTVDVARKMIANYLDRHSLGYAEQSAEDLMKRVIVRPVTGFDKTADELINEVREILDGEVPEILDGKHICRVALDDVAALVPGPEVAFPLKDLFTFRNITSLFVHTVDVGEESSIRESFDNVIRARYVVLPNSVNARIGYRVLKLNGATKGARRSWELRYNENDGSLQVTDAFKEYVEGRDGKLYSLPMRLILHCEFAEFKERWEDPIRAMFGVHDDKATSDLSIQVFTRDEAEGVLDHILILETGYEMSETRVMSFDDPWLDELIEAEKLEPLDDFVDDELAAEFLEKARQNVTKCLGGRRGLYGLPHHIDFGLYAIRTDLVTEEILSRCGVTLEEPLAWEKLARIAKAAQQEYRTRKATELIQQSGGEPVAVENARNHFPRCFDYWTRVDESFVCYILEVLWPPLFSGSHYRGFADQKVVEATFRWYKILEEADSLPSLSAEQPEPAIVQRHWVVSYWKMLRDHPQLKESLQIIPAPRLATDNPPANRQTASICGNWLLGIVRGSPNPSRGMWAIKALTSEAMNRRMQQNKLWLPAHQSLLMHGESRKLCEMYQRSVSRRKIPKYQHVRPILIEGFEEIFAQPGRSEADVGAILADMNQRMKHLQD